MKGYSSGTTGFIANIGKLVTGKVVAQAVSLLSIPLIARLYAPEDFGVLGVFVAITAIFTSISSLRYNFAIMLPKKDEEAINLVVVSFVIIALFSLAAWGLILVFKNNLAIYFNTPALEYYLFYAPMMIFFGGVLSVLHYWYSRQKKFGKYAISGVASTLSGLVFKLLYVVFFPAGPGGLIGAAIFASLAGCIVLIWSDLKYFCFATMKHVSPKALKKWMLRYKDFSLFFTLSGLLNEASAKLPAIMLALFFKPAIVGYYSIGNKMIKTPADLLGQSISNVFFQKLSSINNEKESAGNLSGSLFARMVAFSFLPTVVLAIGGKSIIAIVLGSEWVEAGVYLQILAPYVFMVFIISPISKIFYVNEKQRIFLVFGIVLIFIRFVSLGIGGYTGSPIIAITLFSVFNVLFYTYKCIWLFNKLGYSVLSLIKLNYRTFCYAFPIALIMFFLNRLDTSIFVLISGFILLSAVYYFLIIIHDELLKNIILAKFNKLTS